MVNISVRHDPRVRAVSPRGADVLARFGLVPEHAATLVIDGLQMPLAAGSVVALIGPSGSGKSSVLAELARRFPAGRAVQRIQFAENVALIDEVGAGAELTEAAEILTCAGLGEPRLWLRSYAELSEGERFRARLARAVALILRTKSTGPLLCDEFCSLLHRRAARAVAFNLRRLAARKGLTVVVACSNGDILADLQPDTVVTLSGAGRFTLQRAATRMNRPVSFLRRLSIQPGRKSDYEAFASMHYRPADELGFVDKVFVLRDRVEGDLLGVVVYSHAPLSLRLRNEATDGRFHGRPDLLNREVRILRRLVIHPDVRGCGLGHHLVRKTLPRVGTEFVECLSTLGAFHPVFERAGMRRVGAYECPSGTREAVAALRELDVDPGSHGFALHVARDRRVRDWVMRVVREWYAGTTGGGEARVERQSPQFLAQTFRGLVTCRPVYYLWRRGKRTKCAGG